MRANFVYEKFDKDSDPISDLGIGGVVLNTEWEQRRQMMEKDIQNLKKSKNKEWEEYLREIFIGKTVRGHMTRLPKYDKNTMKNISKSQTGTFTIKIVDLNARGIENKWDNSVIVADEDHNLYSLYFYQKIYIW